MSSVIDRRLEALARSAAQSAQRYPLTVVLGTDAGVRLTRELALHGGQLSAPDLARRTGLAKASVARGLAALEATGIVGTAGTGRAVLYSLRPAHPLVPALSAAFEEEQARFRTILARMAEVARSAGAGLVALWLFGSVARGEDRADSDLDLALIGEPGSLPGLANTFRDQADAAGEVSGFRPSVVALDTGDVARLSAEHDPWWREVARDAVTLAGVHPEALAARLAGE